MLVPLRFNLELEESVRHRVPTVAARAARATPVAKETPHK